MKASLLLMGIVLMALGGAFLLGYVAVPAFLSFLSFNLAGIEFNLPLILLIVGFVVTLIGYWKQY